MRDPTRPAGDLERDVLEAEERRSLAKRLADDLKPSRFLAFLLEEERAELAELGSGLFETLTDGTYRFTDDDSFDIVDLNAADRTAQGGHRSRAARRSSRPSRSRWRSRRWSRAAVAGWTPSSWTRGSAPSTPSISTERWTGSDGWSPTTTDGSSCSSVTSRRCGQAIEDLIVLDKDDRTGDTIVLRP